MEVDGEVEDGRGGFKAAKNAAWLGGEGWGRMWGGSKPYLRGRGRWSGRREEKGRRARRGEKRGRRGETHRERERERERISPSIRQSVNKNEQTDLIACSTSTRARRLDHIRRCPKNHSGETLIRLSASVSVYGCTGALVY